MQATLDGFRYLGRAGVILFVVGSACASPEQHSEPKTLDGLSVTPASASVAMGLNRQLAATASYSDGSTDDQTAQATWSTTASGIATVVGGLVTGVSAGAAKIIAAEGGFADTTEITVTSNQPILTGVVLTPPTASLLVAASTQLVATAQYSDASTSIVTSQATWSSTANGVATVTAGLVAGVAVGNAGIIGSFGGFADTTSVTVTLTQPTLTAVVLAPASTSVAVGGSRQLVATAHYSDASVAIVTSQATWSSTAGGVATVIAGLVAGVAVGNAKIIGGFGGFSDTTAVTVTAAPPPGSYVYPLELGPTGRYLVDQNGRPFLLVGDAAWSLIAQLTEPEAETYLTNRQQNGFTLVLVNLIEHLYADNAPANASGELPFTGIAFQSIPNEAYFARVDRILQSAADKGIVVLLGPAYLGFGCNLGEGWCDEIKAASLSEMTAWGRYIGTRYKDYDNIVWIIGGDTDPEAANPSVKPKLQALVDGILETDTRHLFNAHNGPDQMAVEPWGGAPWLSINNVYTYGASLWRADLTAYHTLPIKPYFLIEAAYEGDTHEPTQVDLRSQSYWTVLSGGFGHVYGACPMWHFGTRNGTKFCAGTDWEGQLNSPGVSNMRNFAKLFNARHWEKLVPDEAHVALTGGLLTDTEFATAAVASDGSSIIAYLPTRRQVTVDGSALTGATMNVWWYDPATGISTDGGSFPTAGSRSLSPPLFNHDWVLVLDSQTFGFPAP